MRLLVCQRRYSEGDGLEKGSAGAAASTFSCTAIAVIRKMRYDCANLCFLFCLGKKAQVRLTSLVVTLILLEGRSGIYILPVIRNLS